MKKKITLGTGIVLILLVALLTFQLTYHFVGLQYQQKVDTLTKTQSDFSLLAEADALIRDHFYGAVDDEAAESGLIDGFVSALGDPYSTYLTLEEYERYQKERSASGNGIGVRLTYDAEKKNTVVYSVFHGSPAQSEGLAPGDVITAINGNDVTGLSFYEVLTALSGEAGTELRLSVRREIALQVLDMDFNLTRAEVKANCLDFELMDGNIGYVHIFSFDEGSVDEFNTAINSLSVAGAKGIVFDVRNTAGGDAANAIAMLDRLLPEGVLARSKDRYEAVTEFKSDESYLDLPMAVLTNSSTSFASELFAAVLKDFGAATLVGEKTYGKSLEQKVFELDNGSVLFLSVLAYMPPSSPSYEGVGVEPDLPCKPEGANLYLMDHEKDTQLTAAVGAVRGS